MKDKRFKNWQIARKKIKEYFPVPSSKKYSGGFAYYDVLNFSNMNPKEYQKHYDNKISLETSKDQIDVYKKMKYILDEKKYKGQVLDPVYHNPRMWMRKKLKEGMTRKQLNNKYDRYLYNATVKHKKYPASYHDFMNSAGDILKIDKKI